MTMITPSYLGETIEYSSLHACRSTLEDPTHRPVEAVDAVVEEEAEPEPSAAPALDVETGEGLQALKRLLRRVEPAEVFATIRAGRDGRATARVLRRGSRRQLAAATASDEATLRGVLREILPNVMLDVAMKPPG